LLVAVHALAAERRPARQDLGADSIRIEPYPVAGHRPGDAGAVVTVRGDQQAGVAVDANDPRRDVVVSGVRVVEGGDSLVPTERSECVA
jgi:hypothetical protein